MRSFFSLHPPPPVFCGRLCLDDEERDFDKREESYVYMLTLLLLGVFCLTRYDFRHKKVGVVGNGSSSIQIVPRLQPLEGIQMTVFMRSSTWISGQFGDAAMVALGLDPTDVECKSTKFTACPLPQAFFPRRHRRSKGD